MPRTPEEQKLATYCLEQALSTYGLSRRKPWEIADLAADYYDFITGFERPQGPRVVPQCEAETKEAKE